MSSILPRPLIQRVWRRWRVMPGMAYALVSDTEGTLWVVVSCPAGTQFWTLEQARQLPQGRRTGRILQEAVRIGIRLRNQPTVRPLPRSRSRVQESPAVSETMKQGTLVLEARPLARRSSTSPARELVSARKK